MLKPLLDIFATAKEALTVKRTFYIPVIWAVATGAIALVPKVSGTTSLWSVPAWAWGIILALAAVCYYLFAYGHGLRKKLGPQFHLSFDQAREGIVQTPFKYRDANGNPIRETSASYVRIRVDSESSTTIDECFAFITRMQKKTQVDTSFEEVNLSAPLSLIDEPRRLHPQVPLIIDFLRCKNDDNKLEPSSPWPLTLRHTFKDNATYAITIKVICGGLTKSITVEVVYNGQWDNITAVERT